MAFKTGMLKVIFNAYEIPVKQENPIEQPSYNYTMVDEHNQKV